MEDFMAVRRELEWGILSAWVIPYLWMPGGHHYRERGIRRLQKRQYGPEPYAERPPWEYKRQRL